MWLWSFGSYLFSKEVKRGEIRHTFGFLSPYLDNCHGRSSSYILRHHISSGLLFTFKLLLKEDFLNLLSYHKFKKWLASLQSSWMYLMHLRHTPLYSQRKWYLYVDVTHIRRPQSRWWNDLFFSTIHFLKFTLQLTLTDFIGSKRREHYYDNFPRSLAESVHHKIGPN